jgi:hypothetical protein
VLSKVVTPGVLQLVKPGPLWLGCSRLQPAAAPLHPHVAREDTAVALGQLVSRLCLVPAPLLTSRPLLAHATPLPHRMRMSWHWLQCTRRPNRVDPIPPSGGDPSADLAVLSPLPAMAMGLLLVFR